ncbi:MAG: hypothetical protein QNJ98_16915 [Planctomycetota bacterium]|nr:hypothetical protein [Planctomycetota bacterium]
MHRPRRIAAALALVAALALAGCGGASGDAVPGLGTLSLVNASHLTQAPAAIDEFFLVPQGASSNPSNQLAAPVDPGGIVIVGLYPEGTYDAALVLEGGFLVPMNGVEIRPDEPTTLTYP